MSWASAALLLLRMKLHCCSSWQSCISAPEKSSHVGFLPARVTLFSFDNIKFAIYNVDMSLLGQATIGTKKVKYNKKVRLETKRFTFFPVKIKQKTLQI
jgi:hypothetical protein